MLVQTQYMSKSDKVPTHGLIETFHGNHFHLQNYYNFPEKMLLAFVQHAII